MAKSELLTIEVRPDLRERFEAAAEAAERAPEDVLRGLIQDYVDRAGSEREYDAWFRLEVAAALREADDPTVRRVPNAEIGMPAPEKPDIGGLGRSRDETKPFVSRKRRATLTP